MEKNQAMTDEQLARELQNGSAAVAAASFSR